MTKTPSQHLRAKKELRKNLERPCRFTMSIHNTRVLEVVSVRPKLRIEVGKVDPLEPFQCQSGSQIYTG